MSIDIREEQLVRLKDVPKLRQLPSGRGAARIHVATVYRWASRGLRGVQLETPKGWAAALRSLRGWLRHLGALRRAWICLYCSRTRPTPVPNKFARAA